MLKKDALMRFFFYLVFLRYFCCLRSLYEKNILFYFNFIWFLTHAQLSNKHWLPPLHSRDDTAIEGHFYTSQLPETNPFQVTITTGNGTPITGSPFTLSFNSPVVVNVGVGQPTSMF